jgi:hypothetical protein
VKDVSEMSDSELYVEAFCGLVCPFPRLSVAHLLSPEELKEQLARRRAYNNRKMDALNKWYKRRDRK